MEGRTSALRPSAARAGAAFALVLGCTDLVPFPTGDGTRVAIIVGDGATRVRLAPLEGAMDVLAEVDPSSTVYLGTLEVPYRALVPYADGAPEAVDLVAPDAPGARALPLIALLDAERRALEALPPELLATHLPALSDNRCAAIEGCADLMDTESAGPVRACLRPCPAATAPAPPAAVARPSAPERATSRAPDGCGVRVPVDTATAGLTIARCGARPPSPPPDCADGDRMTADGACAALASCTDGFPPGLDDRRTWFVDTTAATAGDGTRARPARAVDVAALPAALDTIAARGALTLGPLPPRALTVVGPCPRELRVSGALSAHAPLTLAGLQFSGTLEVRGARARLSGVDWPMPRSAALVAHDDAELDLEDVAIHAPTSTAPGARLANLVDARLSATRVSIEAPVEGARVLLVAGGAARLDGLALDGVELRATRGATVRIDHARAWAADASPLARVDDAELTTRGAVISGRGASTALFIATEARLTLVDLSAHARGAVAFARGAQLEATDVAATLTPGAGDGAFRVEGGTLALARVDLDLRGLTGIIAERSATRVRDLVVQLQAGDDRGLRLSAGTSSVTRAAVFGLGRYGALVYGGRHAWSDLHVALTSTATPRVEPPERQSTGLFLADDTERLSMSLSRARVEGGFFGVHAQMPRGHATLHDVDVGPSTLRRRVITDLVEPCALRLVVVALDAARLRARGHGEQGLLLTVPVASRSGGEAVTIEDLRVEAPVSATPSGEARCLSRLSVDVPAISLLLGPGRSATLARIAVVEAETAGIVASTEPDAQLTLTDVSLEEVRCRMIEHRGRGRLQVSRMRARRRAWPRSQLTADDLVSVTESAQLEAEDVDAEVEVGATRSLLRVNDFGAVSLQRWRARRVTTLLIHDFGLRATDPQGQFVARTVSDGVLEDADRVTSLSPLTCDDVAARPPYRRVRVPTGLRVFDNCP